MPKNVIRWHEYTTNIADDRKQEFPLGSLWKVSAVQKEASYDWEQI